MGKPVTRGDKSARKQLGKVLAGGLKSSLGSVMDNDLMMEIDLLEAYLCGYISSKKATDTEWDRKIALIEPQFSVVERMLAEWPAGVDLTAEKNYVRTLRELFQRLV